jgi:hypothetical protein
MHRIIKSSKRRTFGDILPKYSHVRNTTRRRCLDSILISAPETDNSVLNKQRGMRHGEEDAKIEI